MLRFAYSVLIFSLLLSGCAFRETDFSVSQDFQTVGADFSMEQEIQAMERESGNSFRSSPVLQSVLMVAVALSLAVLIGLATGGRVIDEPCCCCRK